MSNQFEREFRRAWRMKEADVDRAHQLHGKAVASALRLVALFFGVPLCVAAALIVAVTVHHSGTGLDWQLSMLDSELRLLQAERDRAAATGRVPAVLDRKIQVLRARRDELREHRDELREQRRDEGFVVFPVGGGAQAAPLTAGSDFAKAGHHRPRMPPAGACLAVTPLTSHDNHPLIADPLTYCPRAFQLKVRSFNPLPDFLAQAGGDKDAPTGLLPTVATASNRAVRAGADAIRRAGRTGRVGGALLRDSS